MDELVSSLALGVLLAFLAFAGLYRFTRLKGKQVAIIVALGVLALYLPYAILAWPGADVVALHLALYLITPYGLGIITHHWELRAGERSGRWFHWAPATIVMFFITIAVVDAIIISLADRGMPAQWAARLLPEPKSGGQVSSFFPGTVYHDFQEKEELYNQYLEQLEAQRRRGWQVRRGWLSPPVAATPAPFQVEVRDKAGAPVVGASVRVEFLRPSDRRQDRSVTLPAVDAGRYRADVTLPQPGMWDVLIHIRRGEDLHEVRGTTSVQAAADS